MILGKDLSFLKPTLEVSRERDTHTETDRQTEGEREGVRRHRLVSSFFLLQDGNVLCLTAASRRCDLVFTHLIFWAQLCIYQCLILFQLYI